MTSGPGPRAARRAFWVDGRVVRDGAPAISLLDRGARDGEGLFETIRIEGRRLLAFEGHLERLVLSAAELGFPVPPSPEQWRAALGELLEEAGLDDAAARITVTRGIPRGHPARAGSWIDVEPLAARLWRGTRAGAAAAVFATTPFHPGALARHKTTSRLAYHLARDEARAARADEAILVDPDGWVLEGSTSNVFAVVGGTIVTPPLDDPILPGLARARVIRLCAGLGLEVRERPLRRAELAAAEEAFVTNSLQQVVPLGRIGDHEPPGRERASALLAAYRADLEA